MGAAPPMDVAAYLSAKGYSGGGSAPPPMDVSQYLAEKTGQQPQGRGFLGSIAHGVRQVMDRLGPSELRGAAQGAQDYEPEGNGSFHPGVLGAMAKGAWDGLIHADATQSAHTQYARMGVPDTPTSQLSVMGTGGKPMSLGQDRPAGDPSLAATLGGAQDMIAGIPAGGAIGRGIGKGVEAVTDAAKSGATKAILSHYQPFRLKAYADKIGAFGNESDAVPAIAAKLQENDLLYTPGKANFNLQTAKSKIGSQIGQTVKQATENDIMVNPQKVLDQYASTKAAILEQTGKGSAEADDFVKEVLPDIQRMIDKLKPNEAGQVPINKGVSFRQDLQALVKKWDGTTRAPLIQRVAKDLQASMNNEFLNSDSVLGPRLAGLNQKYSDLSDAQVLIDPAYAKSLGQTLAGKKGTFLQNAAQIIKHPIDAAGDPMQAIMKLRPSLAEKIANQGNTVTGIQIPQVARPGVSGEDVAALKAPFLGSAPQDGLPPRVPTMRTALDPQPAYVTPPNDAAAGLPPRQPMPQPRRPLSPIAPDPSLDLGELGKVLDADAAKEIASTQYQSDRLKVLWKKVQEAQTPKQKSALMNLIRAVHNSTPTK